MLATISVSVAVYLKCAYKMVIMPKIQDPVTFTTNVPKGKCGFFKFILLSSYLNNTPTIPNI